MGICLKKRWYRCRRSLHNLCLCMKGGVQSVCADLNLVTSISCFYAVLLDFVIEQKTRFHKARTKGI